MTAARWNSEHAESQTERDAWAALADAEDGRLAAVRAVDAARAAETKAMKSLRATLNAAIERERGAHEAYREAAMVLSGFARYHTRREAERPAPDAGRKP